jgi:hypothetical protein
LKRGRRVTPPACSLLEATTRKEADRFGRRWAGLDWGKAQKEGYFGGEKKKREKKER